MLKIKYNKKDLDIGQHLKRDNIQNKEIINDKFTLNIIN